MRALISIVASMIVASPPKEEADDNREAAPHEGIEEEAEGEKIQIDAGNAPLLNICDPKMRYPLIAAIEYLSMEDRARLRATCCYLRNRVKEAVLTHENLVFDINCKSVAPTFNETRYNQARSLKIEDFVAWRKNFATRIMLKNLIISRIDDAEDLTVMLTDIAFQSLYITTNTYSDVAHQLLLKHAGKPIVIAADRLSYNDCMEMIPASAELRMELLEDEDVGGLHNLVKAGRSICLTSFDERSSASLFSIFEAIAQNEHEQYVALKVDKETLMEFCPLIGVRRRRSKYELLSDGLAHNLCFHEETREDGPESWSFQHGEKMVVNIDDGPREWSMLWISNYYVIMDADGCRMNCNLCYEIERASYDRAMENDEYYEYEEYSDDEYKQQTKSCWVCPVCCKVDFTEVFYDY